MNFCPVSERLPHSPSTENHVVPTKSVKNFKAPIWLSPTPEVGENLRSPNAQ